MLSGWAKRDGDDGVDGGFRRTAEFNGSTDRVPDARLPPRLSAVKAEMGRAAPALRAE